MELENFIYIILFVYAYFIYRYNKGLKESMNQVSGHEGKINQISIIIPYRNEAARLPALIESLKAIEYPKENFEIIFINDSSIDKGPEIIYKKTEDMSNVRLDNLDFETGKKNALRKGITLAKFDKIITTDADCIVPKKWLHSFNSKWNEENISAIIGAVKLENIPDSKLGKFQVLEHNSLQAITLGSGKVNPILASGANLGFLKSDYLEVSKELFDIASVSGDDVFLIQLLNKYKKKIDVIATKESIVSTSALKDLEAFIDQKTRWGSKTSQYIIQEAKYLAWVVLLLNVSILILAFHNIFVSNLSSVLLSSIFVKLVIDYYTIKKVSDLFEQESYLKHIFWVSLLYPIYISITGIKAIFSNFDWKGRTHQA